MRYLIVALVLSVAPSAMGASAPHCGNKYRVERVFQANSGARVLVRLEFTSEFRSLVSDAACVGNDATALAGGCPLFSVSNAALQCAK